MSDLLKSLSSPSGAAAIAGAAAGTAIPSALASAASLPSALANLTAGSVIAGVVVERGRAGIVLLKTDKGIIQLQTNLPLKLGADVVLEVQSVGALLRFAVLSVDQHTPSPSAPFEPAFEQKTPAVVTGDGEGGTTARALPAAANPRNPLTGLVVTADVLAPSAPASRPTGPELIPALLNRIATIAALSEGGARGRVAPIPAVLTDGETPSAVPDRPQPSAPDRPQPSAPDQPQFRVADRPQPGVTEPAAAADTQAPPPVAAPSAVVESEHARPPPEEMLRGSAAVAVTNKTAQQVTIRILAVLPQPAIVSAAVARANVAITGDSITLLGTVVSDNTVEGLKIATPIGALRLPVAQTLPGGAQIAFEVLTQIPVERNIPTTEAAPLDSEPALPVRTLFSEPARDWPAFRELLTAMPQDGGARIAVAMPRPGPDLGPAILLFLASLRGGGNERGWLGQAVIDALDAAGHGPLVDRLGKAFGMESAAASAVDTNGWQTVSVPIAEGERLSELRFHFQRRRKQGNRGNDAGGNRFVVEATLSVLGPLQLDGRVRASRFDLVVRTVRLLPDRMRRDISALFASSLAGTNYAGDLTFRADIHSGVSARRVNGRGAGLVV